MSLRLSCLALFFLTVIVFNSYGEDEDVRKIVEELRKEVRSLRSELSAAQNSLVLTKEELSVIRSIDATFSANPLSDAATVLENKYGPNLPVTSGQGKVKLGGLIQVWYYNVQNDNHALFDSPANGVVDSNEAFDNDSYQIRRAELNFTADITKHITGYMMVDFAREFSSPGLPYNQGFKTGINAGPGGVGSGAGGVPNILQDALINFHSFVPHHDFTIGQYLPIFSQEDFGPNFALDFVERSFIGNQFARDVGLTVHGSWFGNGGGGAYCGAGDSGRLQYWLSMFNGAGSYHQTAGQSQNRVDDNDEFDFLGTLLVRPVWDSETWGNLELAYSGGFGTHGESAPGTNGLGRRQTDAIRHSGWLYYAPGGPVKGWWIKGEYSWIKDRNAPGAVVNLADTTTSQNEPQPFTTRGWYAAIGYKIADSVFEDNVPGWFRPFEFVARYQQFENIFASDLNNLNKTDVFRTEMLTAGFNYYIKGHNAKIQANYNWSGEPHGTRGHQFHNVKNDSFMVNFQVMW